MGKDMAVFVNIVGLIPIIVVIVLYSIILYQALKTISKIKKISKLSVGNFSASDFSGLDPEKKDESKSICPKMRRFVELSEEIKLKNLKKSIFSEPSKGKAILMVVLTSGSFIVTWVPFFMMLHSEECQIYSPLTILGFLNSFLNPLIYAWWHIGFRTNSLKQLKCIFCCNRCKLGKTNVMISITKGQQIATIS